MMQEDVQGIIEALRLFWPLIALQVVLMVWALVDLAKRSVVKTLPKWTWVLVIVFINLFGPILYFLVGRGEE